LGSPATGACSRHVPVMLYPRSIRGQSGVFYFLHSTEQKPVGLSLWACDSGDLTPPLPIAIAVRSKARRSPVRALLFAPEAQMDNTTLIIVLILVLLLFGGGFYGRGRWW
jgi:hypothetical protein